MKLKNKLTLIAGLIASSFALNANAGIVTNATDILTGTGHAQLSEWLGEDVNLTRIFAKGVDGDDSYDWHDHVDGQGATFTVFEVFNAGERMVVGGYNPYSWSESNQYSPKGNSFLFNLTTSTSYQGTSSSGAYNRGAYGVTFGGGHDLKVDHSLNSGYANIGHSYSYGDSRYDFIGSYNSWSIGAYETFTLSESTGAFGMGATASLTESGQPNSVPVPFALAGLSLMGFGFSRKK